MILKLAIVLSPLLLTIWLTRRNAKRGCCPWYEGVEDNCPNPRPMYIKDFVNRKDHAQG